MHVVLDGSRKMGLSWVFGLFGNFRNVQICKIGVPPFANDRKGEELREKPRFRASGANAADRPRFQE